MYELLTMSQTIAARNEFKDTAFLEFGKSKEEMAMEGNAIRRYIYVEHTENKTRKIKTKANRANAQRLESRQP